MSKNMKNNLKRRPNNLKREQPRKDSKSRRINLDNERVSKFDRSIERSVDNGATSKCNDPSWYANSPELMRAAASIPFSPVPGMPLPYDTLQTVPGVMSLLWNPAITDGANAPLNQAANSMYSFTVHANSRNQSYDAVDEMLLVLAGAQVFSALALGIRAYGLMQRYSQIDKYTPEAILQASGFDPADLRANYSQMWFDLNEMIARTQQIWIPNTMPVIARWFWLNSNVYMDANSAKAQFYVFCPAVFYKYDETTMSTGGSLQPVEWSNGSTKNTWSTYKSKINELINALINSQDRGIIFGDILKAYGADKLYAIQSLPVDYRLEPVHDTEVLTQIENATVWDRTTYYGIGPIVQSNDVSYLYQVWTSIPTSGGAMPTGGLNNQVLNFHQIDVPTPEQIMVATRLKTIGSKVYGHSLTPTGGESTNWNIGPVTAGTEVILKISVWMYTKSSDGTYALQSNALNQTFTTSSNPTSTNIYLWSAFDWAPWLYSRATITSAPIVENSNYLINPQSAYGDWDNYTFITLEELEKMNVTAIYSEFGVPVLG